MHSNLVLNGQISNKHYITTLAALIFIWIVMIRHLLEGDFYLMDEVYLRKHGISTLKSNFLPKKLKIGEKHHSSNVALFYDVILIWRRMKLYFFFTKIYSDKLWLVIRVYNFKSTEIIQSQASLPGAIILKVDVYFDWHMAVPSLTTMQQKSGNNKMCTLHIFVVVITCDVKKARSYFNV